MEHLKAVLVIVLSLPAIPADSLETERPSKILSQKPAIKTHPTDQYSIDGVLEFICQAEGNPKPFIQWHNASTGQLITDRIPSTDSLSGIHVNPYHGRLMISNPTRGQLYSFYCNATNEHGWTVSQPPVFGALAYFDDEFQEQPSNQSVHLGENISLHCLAPQGLPKPGIQWIRGNTIVAELKGAYSMQRSAAQVTSSVTPQMSILKNGTLRINSVAFKHSGSYHCVATNIVGTRRSATAFLSVMSAATFFETPKHLRVRVGEDAKFFCESDDPTPVTWRRAPQDGPLDPSRTVITRSFLLIKNVHTSDTGTYICSVPGFVGHNATLVVDTPPRFLRPPKNVEATVGDAAVFICVVTGQPQPSVYWELPDMTPVFPSEENTEAIHSKHYVHVDGRLEVRNVQIEDAGRYQCTAHSSIDTIHASALLSVTQVTKTQPQLGKTKLYYPKSSATTRFSAVVPIIELPPANQTVSVGNTVTFTCEPSESSYDQATPNSVTVSWKRRTYSGDEKAFKNILDLNEHRFQTSDSTLQILDVRPSDAGVYICSVISRVSRFDGIVHGEIPVESSWSASLQVTWKREVSKLASVLPPPTNLRAVNLTSTSVTISWEPPHLTSLWKSQHRNEFLEPLMNSIAYWIEYYREDRPMDGWLVVEENWPMSNVQLRGLEPNVQYFFLVRSRWTQDRVGWASKILGPVRTPSISSEKTSVTSNDNGYSNLLYQSTPLNLKVQIVEMTILSKSTAKINWSLSPVTDFAKLIKLFKLSYTISPINYCLSAFNKPKSTHVYVLSSAREYCSFDGDQLKKQVLQSQLDQMHKLYNAMSQKNSSTFSVLVPWVKPNQVDGPPSEYLVGWLHNLTPFTCYSITVQPILTDPSLSSMFRQIKNEAEFLLTPEGIPTAAPSNLSAKWIDDRLVQLNWQVPIVTQWNGPLTGFLIYIFDENSNERKTVNVTHLVTETVLELHRLTNSYLFQLACMTCAGVGIPSQPIRLLGTKNKMGEGLGSHTPANQFELLRKPWFVGTLIGSVIAWCLLITLATSCCFRLRHRRLKPQQFIGLQIATALNDQSGRCDRLLYMKQKGSLDHPSPLPVNGLLYNTDRTSAHTSPCGRSRSHTDYLPSCVQQTKHIQVPDGSNLEARTSSVTSSREHSLVKEPQCAMRPSMSVSTDRSIRTLSENHPGLRCLASQSEGDTTCTVYPHDMLPPFQVSPQTMCQFTNPHMVSDDNSMFITSSPFVEGSAATTESFLSHSSRVLMNDSVTATPYATASLITQNQPVSNGAFRNASYPSSTNVLAVQIKPNGALINRCQTPSSSEKTSYASSCGNSESLRESILMTEDRKHLSPPAGSDQYLVPAKYHSAEPTTHNYPVRWNFTKPTQQDVKPESCELLEFSQPTEAMLPKLHKTKKQKPRSQGVHQVSRNEHSGPRIPVEHQAANQVPNCLGTVETTCGKRYFAASCLPPPPPNRPPPMLSSTTDLVACQRTRRSGVTVKSKARYSYTDNSLPPNHIAPSSGFSVETKNSRDLPASS